MRNRTLAKWIVEKARSITPPVYRACSRRPLQTLFVVAAAASLIFLLTFGPSLQVPHVVSGPSGISPALPAGTYFDMTCTHSKITLNGTSVCHDQSNNQIAFAGPSGGTHWATMSATVDTGYVFDDWSVSGACLGTSPTCTSTSTSNPTGVWAYCASGKRCVDSVTQTSGVLQVLSAYNDTPSGYGLSHTLSFTVPSGGAEVFFVWSVSDTVAPTLTLATGLSTQTSFGNSTGIASGSLSGGSDSVSLSANGGWVNTVTMVAYALQAGSQYSFTYSSHSQVTSLTLTSGALWYVGVLETGGAYPLTSPSLTTINAETPSQNGGETDLIGYQSSNTLSFSTTAAGYGIAAVGIYQG
jgi:hypothetical protein